MFLIFSKIVVEGI